MSGFHPLVISHIDGTVNDAIRWGSGFVRLVDVGSVVPAGGWFKVHRRRRRTREEREELARLFEEAEQIAEDVAAPAEQRERAPSGPNLLGGAKLAEAIAAIEAYQAAQQAALTKLEEERLLRVRLELHMFQQRRRVFFIRAAAALLC